MFYRPNKIGARLVTAVGSAALLLALSQLPARAQPALPPTAPAAYAILHSGSAAQSKTGRLTVDQLCLGGTCRNEWPGDTPQVEEALLNGSDTATCYTGATLWLTWYNSNAQGDSLSQSSGYRKQCLVSFNFTIDTEVTPLSVTSDVRCWTATASYALWGGYIFTRPSSLQISHNNGVYTVSGACSIYPVINLSPQLNYSLIQARLKVLHF